MRETGNSKEEICFEPGYHMFAWLSTQNISHGDLENVCAEIKRISEEEFQATPIEGLYCGFCFGKFDLVVSFWCESGKVASHFISTISCRIRELELISTFSSLLCKKVILKNTRLSTDEGKNLLEKCVIKIFVYLRPAISRARGQSTVSMGSIVRAFGECIDIQPKMYNHAQLFWNDSAYPLVIVLSGNKAATSVDAALDIRRQLGQSVCESSTFITLKFGRKDLDSREFSVITFVKQREFPSELKVEFPIERLTSQKNGTILDCLGWNDFCLIHKAKNLHEIRDRVFSLREKNPGEIYQTSTIFLRSVPYIALNSVDGK